MSNLIAFLMFLPQFPRRLVETLVADLRRGQVPEVEVYERAQADAWLCRVAVDWQALVRHVRRLQKWVPEPGAFGDPLPPEVLAAVLERGPGAITDPVALAHLLLNANQLIQLHEAVYGDAGSDEPPAAPETPAAEPAEPALGGGPTAFWLDVIDRIAELTEQRERAKEHDQVPMLESAVRREIAVTFSDLKPGQTARSLDLLETEGQALKAEILARCYGGADDVDDFDEPFGLTLHAHPVEGDADLVRLHLTVTPAPVRSPLELTLTFTKLSGAPAVKFVIPAYGDGRRAASSQSSDPLPRAAFEFTAGDWENQWPLRLSVRGAAQPTGASLARLTRELTFSSHSVRLLG
jgi:hypothetical protein